MLVLIVGCEARNFKKHQIVEPIRLILGNDQHILNLERFSNYKLMHVLSLKMSMVDKILILNFVDSMRRAQKILH